MNKCILLKLHIRTTRIDKLFTLRPVRKQKDARTLCESVVFWLLLQTAADMPFCLPLPPTCNLPAHFHSGLLIMSCSQHAHRSLYSACCRYWYLSVYFGKLMVNQVKKIQNEPLVSCHCSWNLQGNMKKAFIQWNLPL